ncbi:NAD(P)-dependent oxidoreductase [Nocardia sp. NPDC006044]|uniref:NAD(P)-dependent oxidoreductase n=1 Tax=Nocardia sp. NPDC006044 TaxID=3364306 RepID=UPI00367619AE
MSGNARNTAQHVAIFGAGGRVGRAATAALLQRSIQVTAVLRDPARQQLPSHPNLRVAQGDAEDPSSSGALLETVDAVVLTVTPFTAPPDTFDGFDLDYYAKIVIGIDESWRRQRRRLVAVGLTASLLLDSGELIRDDPSLFPAELAPFATAHVRELAALRTTKNLDWAILTPPAGFGTESAGGLEYRLIAEPVTRFEATSQLSHSTYAQALTDEITNPTTHESRVLVAPGSIERAE